jgi:hypothetical protein
MSWKPYFIIKSEGDKHCMNAQAFATKEEALASANSRFMRWTMPSDCGADESDEPVNYRWDDQRGDVPLEKTK